MHLLGVGGGRLIGQFLTLLNARAHRVPKRRAQLVGRVARVVGFFFDSIDLVHRAHVVVERHSLADQSARVGQRRFGGRGGRRRYFFLRARARYQNFGNRAGQLIDAAFESPCDFAVALHKRRHLLNRIEQGFLQFQLALQSITL